MVPIHGSFTILSFTATHCWDHLAVVAVADGPLRCRDGLAADVDGDQPMCRHAGLSMVARKAPIILSLREASGLFRRPGELIVGVCV